MATVALPDETSSAQKACLRLYSAIANYVVKRFVTEENIAAVDVGIETSKRQGLM